MLWQHNAIVNSHQRWKQMRFRVWPHLWCELTSTMNVTEWQVSWNSLTLNIIWFKIRNTQAKNNKKLNLYESLLINTRNLGDPCMIIWILHFFSHFVRILVKICKKNLGLPPPNTQKFCLWSNDKYVSFIWANQVHVNPMQWNNKWWEISSRDGSLHRPRYPIHHSYRSTMKIKDVFFVPPKWNTSFIIMCKIYIKDVLYYLWRMCW